MGEYHARCTAFGTDRKLALRDLAWDLDKGHATLAPVPAFVAICRPPDVTSTWATLMEDAARHALEAARLDSLE